MKEFFYFTKENYEFKIEKKKIAYEITKLNLEEVFKKCCKGHFTIEDFKIKAENDRDKFNDIKMRMNDIILFTIKVINNYILQKKAISTLPKLVKAIDLNETVAKLRNKFNQFRGDTR